MPQPRRPHRQDFATRGETLTLFKDWLSISVALRMLGALVARRPTCRQNMPGRIQTFGSRTGGAVSSRAPEGRSSGRFQRAGIARRPGAVRHRRDDRHHHDGGRPARDDGEQLLERLARPAAGALVARPQVAAFPRLRGRVAFRRACAERSPARACRTLRGRGRGPVRGPAPWPGRSKAHALTQRSAAARQL